MERVEYRRLGHSEVLGLSTKLDPQNMGIVVPCLDLLPTFLPVYLQL